MKFFAFKRLLQELIGHTSIRHKDYFYLTKAITKLKGIAFYINEQKRRAERNALWNEIGKKIVGIDPQVSFYCFLKKLTFVFLFFKNRNFLIKIF